ncbi:adenylate/guanylate cyclase domain-containing protein [soil metagenome]
MGARTRVPWRVSRRTTRRLAAVWFADIVDFTRLSSGDETAALRLVEILQSGARRQTEAFSGHIVKFMGDGVLAEFGSTEAAVRSALALQREFESRAAKLGTEAKLRVGVHVGDLVSTPDGDIYGDGVNTASRLQNAAEPGEVLVSEDVWRQLRRRAAFSFCSHGERELAGASEAVQVYGVTAGDEEAPADGLSPSFGELPDAAEDSRGRRRIAAYLAGALVIVAVLASAFLLSGRVGAGGDDPLTGSAGDMRPSVAVLPFRNLIDNPANEYFSDGITEDVLANLAKIAGLRVISRTSAENYRDSGKSLREMGRELGVGAVLDGSVRRAEDRVRITAQLVDARTEERLWVQSYDREMTDIFAIQSDIARQIAAALRAELTPEERERIARTPTGSLTAYDLYLKGREHLNNYRTQQDNEAAIGLFQQALRLDPQFPLAYAGLGRAYTVRSRYGEPRWLDSAVVASQKAVELGPDLSEGYTALAKAYAIHGKFRTARDLLERALKRNPNDAEAYDAIAQIDKQLGRYDAALQSEKRAVRLDPTRALYSASVGELYGEMGDLTKAEEWIRQALALDPAEPWGNALLVYLEVLKGDYGKVERQIPDMLAAAPRDVWMRQQAGWYELLRGNPADALRYYEEAAALAPAGDLEPLEAAFAYLQTGDDKKGRQLLEKHEQQYLDNIKSGYEGPEPYYQLARIAAIRNQPKNALERLGKAYREGDRRYQLLQLDPLLAPLRREPAFGRITEEMRRATRNMRARVESGATQL